MKWWESKEVCKRILKYVSNQDNQCSVCDNFRDLWMRFCPHCGVPNHHFSMDALNHEYGGPNGTIEEAMQNGCQQHWHIKLECIDENDPECIDARFCPICGFEK